MKINDFKLECYFGRYEFAAPYPLTQSDCESMTAELLLDMEPGAKEAYLRQWLGYTETWGDPELRVARRNVKGVRARGAAVDCGASNALNLFRENIRR